MGLDTIVSNEQMHITAEGAKGENAVHQETEAARAKEVTRKKLEQAGMAYDGSTRASVFFPFFFSICITNTAFREAGGKTRGGIKKITQVQRPARSKVFFVSTFVPR